MKKYKKNSNNKRLFLKLFISFLIIVIVLGICAIAYLLVNNNISIYKANDKAKNVSVEEAKNSTPLVINNLLLGGVYNSKFVSIDKYFFNSVNKEKTKINLYSLNGKIGEYEINSIRKDDQSSAVYISHSKENLIDEYIATTSSYDLGDSKLSIASIKDEDYKNVKESLGLYTILNSSIEINKVYETSIEKNEPIRIICASNATNKGSGVYSVVSVVDGYTSKSQVIKYNYLRDKNDSKDFGILSVKFVADLNGDGKKEIILQETKEFNVKYMVFEKINNSYYEVLSTEFKI